MTYTAQYEEHLAHSAYDHAEAFAGFDRGDTGRKADVFCGSEVVGRLRSESGAVVEIVRDWQDHEDFGFDEVFEVRVDGNCVSPAYGTKDEAAVVARWWLAGCPA